MPVVEIHVLEGYSVQDKQRLGVALTQGVRRVVPADPDAVTVMIHEMSAGQYYRGGKSRIPAPALPDPQEVVRSYLQSMEARDLPSAETYLAKDFVMQFPGSRPMTQLAQLMAWSDPRYQSISKTYDGFDTASGDDCTVVYCRGALHGVWPDGRAFKGIRFIDRFELVGGKITRQDVWNDIAETKVNA